MTNPTEDTEVSSECPLHGNVVVDVVLEAPLEAGFEPTAGVRVHSNEHRLVDRHLGALRVGSGRLFVEVGLALEVLEGRFLQRRHSSFNLHAELRAWVDLEVALPSLKLLGGRFAPEVLLEVIVDLLVVSVLVDVFLV